MKKIKTLSLIVGAILCGGILLTGCGGGDSSSKDNTSSLFPSNAVMAEPTTENAKEVRDIVIGNQVDITDNMPDLSLNKVSNDSKLNIIMLNNKISNKLFEFTKDIKMQPYSLNEVIDETEKCSNGGTISYKGSGDDVNGGSLTITANNCEEDNVIINGKIYMTIKNRDTSNDEFKDYKVEYLTDFKIEDSSDNSMVKIFSNSYIAINVMEFDSYGDWKNYKLSGTLKVTDGTKHYGFQDCIYYFTKKVNSTSYYTTQCRIYINNLASYVDYDKDYNMSNTPFEISNDSTLISGEAHYKMANNSKMKIVVESNEAKVYLDDGNGSFKLVK